MPTFRITRYQTITEAEVTNIEADTAAEALAQARIAWADHGHEGGFRNEIVDAGDADWFVRDGDDNTLLQSVGDEHEEV